jgi:hypothetical protein
MNGAQNAPTLDEIVGHYFNQRKLGDLCLHERILLKRILKG